MNWYTVDLIAGKSLYQFACRLRWHNPKLIPYFTDIAVVMNNGGADFELAPANC